MNLEDHLYQLGLAAERFPKYLKGKVKGFLIPTPSNNPPSLRLSHRIIKGKRFTIHELISLHLQLCFVTYLAINFVIVFLTGTPLYLLAVSIPYFLYLRHFLIRYGNFLIEEKPYRIFYYGISAISFLAFLGYSLLELASPEIYHYYVYVGIIALAVLLFRHYFKATFGRDYTYGTVEEVKGDMVRVFIHDDMAANIKPGFYWLPAVEEAEPGRVVKVLVEDRTFRSARPVRILEVYLGQSSQSSTEPKEETE
ncbi:hypothetical protein APY94_03475 [Thermococcus celericrescens]|uniref:DUF2101 domain-containing protein n=1 Tax=Thermococcus celericrescens TaxID=227598 RepID=A0A100XYV8_9EURY|nr:DUF2101 family protein [Thermococcus celericrescens]KUH34045.1 hypothetical protein APY94_03475 [Thermococcus celericrescens]